MSAPANRRLSTLATFLIDGAFVVAFCIIGRVSHESGIFGDLPGLLGTIWPFVAALILAHGAAVLTKRDASRILPGLAIWAVTVIGGLALRAVSGQGTALSFMIVTTLVVAAFLLGWRVIRVLVMRKRQR